ncbi:cytochrome P450 [Nocardia sp. NPDC058379]|uniref:cytochrome P450 n=1 Tax=unclassified Nocardia TaxID=2637762 RepID=UPI003665F75B
MTFLSHNPINETVGQTMKGASMVTQARHADRGGSTRKQGRPPGPGVLAATRILAKAPRDMLFGYLPRIAAEYGDVVDLPIPGLTATLLSHPDHVEHVFIKNNERYAKLALTNELTAGEPPALPILAGAEWKRVRRQVNPYFAEKALANVTEAMVTTTIGQLERWEAFADSGNFVNLEHEFGSIVMSTLLQSMFTYSVDNATVDRWVDAATDFGGYIMVRGLMGPLPSWIPRPRERKGRAAQSLFLGELDSMIKARLAAPEREQKDVLDVLLGMEFEGDEDQQYRRMRSELSGLVFAGFDTTAEALAWTIAMLSQTPDALAKAYAAVDALGGRTVAYTDVEQLSYLRACFDEAQRLQAAPLNGRTSTEDDEIGGYRIPAGSHVLISPYGLQRDARFWVNPDWYNPDRWVTDDIDKNAFVPFSTGPRKCMGSRMAYISGVLTLASILQRYTFEVREGWKPRHELHLSIGLAGGLPVRVHRR